MDAFVRKHWGDFGFKRLTEDDVLKMDNPIEAWIALEEAYKELDRVMELHLKVQYLYFEKEKELVNEKEQ